MKPTANDKVDYQYSLTGIHLPERKALTRKFEITSFALNDFVLASATLGLLGNLTNSPFLKNVFNGLFSLTPTTSLLFILAGISLIFSAKYYLTDVKSKKKSSLDFGTITPILFGIIISILGLLSIFDTFWQQLIPPMVGFNFILLSIALILPHVRVGHRFHITQLLTYIVLVISSITILGYIYEFFLHTHTHSIIPLPLNIALLFFLFCHSILLRWSNRGFFGNFTADCFSSVYALRLLTINLLLTPFIGFIVLTLTENNYHDVHMVLALLVLLLMVVTTIIAWFNMKLLYRFELEHFAVKEALRVHNILLVLDKKSKDVKLVELEKTKNEYKDKLNHQSKLGSILENLG